MVELVIREYRKDDHDAVWELHNVALNQVGAHAGNGAWDDDLHHIQAVYFDNSGAFLVGTHEDSVVAMGALQRISEEKAAVRRMRVHPDFQRRGFGQAILSALETRAEAFGYRILHLDTTVRQVAARGLYEKNGYRAIGREKIAGFDVLRYEKILMLSV